MDKYITEPIILIGQNSEVVYQNNASKELNKCKIDEKDYISFFQDYYENEMNLNTTHGLENKEFEIEIPKEHSKVYFTCILKEYIWEEIEECLIFFLRNITDQKLYNQFKDLMISTVSHDVRTPLNCSITLTKISLEKIEDQEIKKNLEISLKSSKLLLALINDLLDFSQVNAHKFRLNHSNFNLSEFVDEVKHFYDFLIREKNLDFVIEENFPKNLIVNSDKERLLRVILNFLGNSLKFTMVGNITFSVTYFSETNELKMFVSDTGIGISEENKKKLFKLWGTISNDQLNRNGIGLGLTISNMIVCALKEIEEWNTGIHVDSEVGVGSKFSFNFPLRDYSESYSLENSSSFELPVIDEIVEISPQKAFFNGKLLVIEDEETNIYVMKTLLAKKGTNFVICRNGQEALQVFDQELQKNLIFKLILSDINMPVMNGFQFIQNYRKMEIQYSLPKAYIIACSANISNRDRQLFTQYGFDSFLEKPLDLPKIEGILDNYF